MKNVRAVSILLVGVFGLACCVSRLAFADDPVVTEGSSGVNPVDSSLILEKTQKRSNRNSSHGNCYGFKSGADRDACLAEKKSRQISAAQCNRLTDKDRLSDCWENFARQNKDTSFCSEVPSGIRRSECVRRVAKQNKNIAECDRLDSSRDRERCYVGFVENSDDGYICDQRVDDPRIKASCEKRLLRKQTEKSRKYHRGWEEGSWDSNSY